ncbi:uncharacterized protein LOC125664563 [Ostrea edulis]|uniref:uncharacterized protein LOC125664563 n=1 Tax=Ostrea edulis TaxID=37623 RepID=UPI0024AEF773|nr:uncharacterized protein LOC125664563 [Ostrea edulis]
MDVRVIVQLAEIMCQGVRSHQDDCRTSNSTCCYNYYFDKGTGRCVECALGSFGSNCKESCVSGYYGYLCKIKCECEAHHCDPVTGCTEYVHEYNTGETMSPNNSTVEIITQEEGPIDNAHVREGVHEDKHSDHHNTNQWMPVSFLLIGSLATMSIVGILIYLRTTRRCKIGSRYPELDGINVEQEVDDENPADTTLAEEEQTDDYAEIRYSQFNDCSTTLRKFNNSTCTGGEIGACGIGNRTIQNVYDRYDNGCEYSRLQLGKKQSRIISQDGTQKLGDINQDEEVYVSLKPSDITNSPFTKANTLPRNSRINIDENEKNTEFSHDIIRSTSESKLIDFQKDSLKPVTRMEVSMTREIQREDTMVDFEGRPYSLVKFLDIAE